MRAPGRIAVFAFVLAAGCAAPAASFHAWPALQADIEAPPPPPEPSPPLPGPATDGLAPALEPIPPPAEGVFVADRGRDAAAPHLVDLFAEGGALGTGSQEVIFGFGYKATDHQSDEAEGFGEQEFTANALYGYYLATGFELALEALVMWSKDDRDDGKTTNRDFGAGLSPRYYFDVHSDILAPYVGLRALLFRGESDARYPVEGIPGRVRYEAKSRGWLYGFVAGLKFFPDPAVSIYVEYQWAKSYADQSTRAYYPGVPTIREEIEQTRNWIVGGITFYF